MYDTALTTTKSSKWCTNRNIHLALLIFLAATMVDIAALISFETRNPIPSYGNARPAGFSRQDTTMLMPSQVRNGNNKAFKKPSQQKRQQSRSTTSGSWMVPSQVFAAHPESVDIPPPSSAGVMPASNPNQSTSRIVDDDVESNLPMDQLLPPSSAQNKRARRRNRNKKRGSNAVATSGSNSTTTMKRNSKAFSPTGDLPDVQWRSIPMEHLRHHPKFHALPPSESITQLQSLEDVRYFRQESWQWDALHAGRCTTSQAVAALGFLEPQAAECLGISKGWRRGGQGAFYRLRKPALRTLEEMNAVLCQNNKDDDDYEPDKLNEYDSESHPNETTITYTNQATTPNASTTDANSYWSTQPRKFPFAAKYMVPVTAEEIQQRKHQAKVYTQSPGIQWSIRMIWGNVQEATSVLTALNYFWKQDSNIVLKEVGMCGAGLAINDTAGLLVGATPDGLLVHPDGTVEALEVKNHCPFLPNSPRPSGNNHRSNNRRSTKGKFRIGRQELSHGVLPQYFPQLMMEMLCVGEKCKSAVMVRQSALNGALILCLHRDDDWINEMVYWLQRFQNDFVQRNEVPPTDFFYNSTDDRTRYQAFLESTKRLESKVEVLSHIPNGEVQRAVGTFPAATCLFLD